MQWKHKGHEYDPQGKWLASKQRLYFYGLGVRAVELWPIVAWLEKDMPWEIVCVDRDPEKQRTEYHGHGVISPQEMLSDWNGDNLIFVTFHEKGAADALTDDLVTKGVDREDIVWCCDEDFFLFLTIYMAYAASKAFFYSGCLVVTTVCNLNCRDCLNFTPYLRENIVYSLEEAKRNIDIFFRAVDRVYRFQISGGEPLLYPELPELLDYIGSHYGDRIFRLETVTNGTLLPDARTCDALRRNHVTVFLDDYRMSLPPELATRHDEIATTLEQEDVTWVDNRVEEWFRLYAPKRLQEKMPEEKLRDMFQRCRNPFQSLEHGKLWACNFAGFADKAGVLRGDPSEMFDLSSYTKEQLMELIEFRTGYTARGYVNLCHACNGWARINQLRCQPAIQEERMSIRGGQLHEVDEERT